MLLLLDSVKIEIESFRVVGKIVCFDKKCFILLLIDFKESFRA